MHSPKTIEPNANIVAHELPSPLTSNQITKLKGTCIALCNPSNIAWTLLREHIRWTILSNFYFEQKFMRYFMRCAMLRSVVASCHAGMLRWHFITVNKKKYVSPESFDYLLLLLLPLSPHLIRSLRTAVGPCKCMRLDYSNVEMLLWTNTDDRVVLVLMVRPMTMK